MTTTAHHLQVYEELAEWYDRQCQAKLRDWFLVLAADAAISLGQEKEAERLRQRLLHFSPHHLLKPYLSFVEALKSPDVCGYIADLRSAYPPESAEQLLHSTHQQKPTREEAEPELPLEVERELKVFRAKEVQPLKPPPTQKPDPPPAAAPMPLPVAWARPDLSAGLRRPELAAAAEKTPAESQESPGALDRWVPLVLFVLILAIGTALAFYTLVWPFFGNEF